MKIHLTKRDGALLELDVQPDGSLMEAIRQPGEIAALCGGAAMCGTCHVHVDPEFVPFLEEMQENEDNMLSSSPDRSPQSRLSCQVNLTPDLDGLAISVAKG